MGPGPWAQAHASGIYMGGIGGIGGYWGGYWGDTGGIGFRSKKSVPVRSKNPFRSKKSVPFHNPMLKTVPFRSLYIPGIKSVGGPHVLKALAVRKY